MLNKIKFTMPMVTFSVNGLWKRNRRVRAEHLCLSVLSQARQPVFYERWGVPDTLEGRFDCACLHMILLLRHLKGSLAQAVFDIFFSYTELTLREEGVSDLRVGKQVRKCATFFYGALKAYSDALENDTGLEEALLRNLYSSDFSPSLQCLKEYVKCCDHLLKGQDFEKMISLPWPKESEIWQR